MSSLYDNENPESIEFYAKKLLNKTLRDLYGSYDTSTGRGALGQAVEKYHFKYSPNSNSEPDFPKASLELKVTPLRRLKNGDLVAKERLVLNIIDFMEEYKKEWKTSSFWKKNKRLLLMFYIHEDETSIFDLLFRLAGIWNYPKEDLIIIKRDWETIREKIKSGNAHQISEGDTLYLGACTKGAGHGANLRPQPFSKTMAKQRAYSLKRNYLDIIAATWLKRKKTNEVEKIIKDVSELEREQDFERLVIKKFEPLYGKEPSEIEKILNLTGLNPSAKNYFATLSLRILGVYAKNAEEFEKADIKLKTLRLKVNGMPKEDMSFPYFKYKEIVEEDWENSSLKEMLEKKFFFVVYKYDKFGKLRLKKAAFWNIPYQDLDSYVQDVWNKTVLKIKSGDAANLPKKRDNYVCHVRPHGRDSKDKDQTPNGTWLTKKSFWLNGRYLRDQLEEIDSRELS